MNIHWYPGHMTKARRLMEKSISLVDIVIELLDARIPMSSRNPDIGRLAQGKRRIVVLGKADLADPGATAIWAAGFEKHGFAVVEADCASGKGVGRIVDVSRALMKEKTDRLKAKGRVLVPIRVMVAGIPNVGKSTLINRLAGRAAAETADRPGVTRGEKWVKIKKDFELLDTPGILWPKLGDEAVGLNLAFTGAVKDDVVDVYELSLKLIERLSDIKPQCLNERYGVGAASPETPAQSVLENIAIARGFKIKGGEPDAERAAIMLTDEFRAGKLGRITLES